MAERYGRGAAFADDRVVSRERVEERGDEVGGDAPEVAARPFPRAAPSPGASRATRKARA